MLPTDRPSRAPSSRGLAVEAAALGVALIVCAAATTYLQSERALRRFVRRPPAADLVQRSGDAAAREIVVPAGSGRRRVALATLSFSPHTTYVILVRAFPGGAFRLVGVDLARGAPRFSRTIPPRPDADEALLVVDSDDLPPRLRFQLSYDGAPALRIGSITLNELSPARGRLLVMLRALGGLWLAAFLWRRRRELAAGWRAPDRAFDAVAMMALFGSLLALYHAAPVSQVVDSRYLTAFSDAFLTTGRASLPLDFEPAGLSPPPYQLHATGGRLRSYFPPGPVYLDLPFVAAYRVFGVRPLTPDGGFLEANENRILRFIASFLGAGICVLLYGLGRIWLTPARALAWTLLFALGTQLFSSVSRPFWSHSWAVLLLAASLWTLLAPALRGRRWPPLAAGTLLALAFLCRPTSVLAIGGIVIWLLFVDRRRALLVVAGGLPWLALVLASGFVALGDSGSYVAFHLARMGLGGSSLRGYVSGALGTLVSPARGLLLFTPIVGWIVWAVAARRRRLPERGLGALALAVPAAHWQMLAGFDVWWGGQQCFGPRLFSDVLPFLFVGAALATAAGPAPAGGRRRALGRLGFVLLAAFSIFVHSRGAWDGATLRWRSYHRPSRVVIPYLVPDWAWNWSYPQFLAGLLPAAPPAGAEDEAEP